MTNESSPALRLWLRVLAALLTIAFATGAFGEELDTSDGVFDASDQVTVDLMPDDPGPAVGLVVPWTFPSDEVSYPSHHPGETPSAKPRDGVLDVAPKRPPPTVCPA